MIENFLNKRILKLRNRHFLILDIIFLSLTPLLSLIIRLDAQIDPNEYYPGIIWCTAIFLVLKILVFYKLGLYNRYWNSASIDELAKIIFIVFWAVLIQTSLFIVFNISSLFGFNNLPLSLPLLDGIFTFIFVASTRFSLRLIERLNERRK